jgi:hypothetical protein
MKLGIVVVYLFDEEDEPLLDLHLSQIEKHTQVPFVIYGSANRLAPRFRERLALHPKVQICECPDTDLRGDQEHSYYLDHLVTIAFEDNASHIVSLHLDSFPISSGWAEALASKLSASCVFATVERINTACLFFHRDFYRRYHPTFLLSEAERAEPQYQQYLMEHDPFTHSGIGYGFMAYSKGLSWYYLRSQNGSDSSVYGLVHEDMIFHLGGVVRLREHQFGRASILTTPRYVRFANIISSMVRSILPPDTRARNFLRPWFSALKYHLLDRPRLHSEAQQVKNIQREMVEDLESHLNRLKKSDP